MSFLGPIIVNVVVLIVFLIYFAFRKEKAIEALRLAWKSFKRIFPLIALVLLLIIFIQKIVLIDFVASFVSTISGFWGYLISAVIGSLFHLPHFVAFPIGGQLLRSGVNPGIIGVFITSLIMVHTFTIPIEIKELGFKFALARNFLSFMFAIIIGVIIGVFF